MKRLNTTEYLQEAVNTFENSRSDSKIDDDEAIKLIALYNAYIINDVYATSSIM